MVRRLVLVPAIVCALLAVAPAVGSADQGGTNRPFKATQTGIVTELSLTSPTTFSVVITATSIATHLGKGTAVADTDSTVRVPLVPCVTPSGPGVLADFTGTGTATAANGDRLFSSFSGTSCLVAAGISTTSGTGTWVGGTGRFLDVSGSFTLTGTVDGSVSPEATTNQVVGRISY